MSTTTTESYLYECECGQKYWFADQAKTTEVINKGETNESTRPFGGDCGSCGRGRDGFALVPPAEEAPTPAPEEPTPPPPETPPTPPP